MTTHIPEVERLVEEIVRKYGIITEPDHSDFLREKLTTALSQARQEGREKACDEIYDAINQYVGNHPTYDTPDGANLVDIIDKARGLSALTTEGK